MTVIYRQENDKADKVFLFSFFLSPFCYCLSHVNTLRGTFQKKLR